MPRSTPCLATVLTLAAVTILGASQAGGAGPKFYPDDPIAREPETRDATGAKEYDVDLAYELLFNLFAKPGDTTPDVRAGNANTIDEVPDSSWFDNRILARPVTIEEAVRGPNTIDGPAPGTWSIIAPKRSGVSPGFTIRDQRGDVWFVSFDAKGNPEAATAAATIATKIFWVLGYHQVETYLTTLDPKQLTIREGATIRPPSGVRRPLRMSDIEAVLARAHRGPDGRYRIVVGRGVPGDVLGGFQYFGTRPDDPNDLVPHEHRRELRALKVFGAWTNLVDMKAGNTLDTSITENGRTRIRHYLQDVGSTFGTGALGPREWDEGYEYLYEGDALWKRLVSFGFYIKPWQTVPYEKHPSIGRFEGDEFDPLQWKTRAPNAALRQARFDDTFWAARRVMAFSDDLIRAIVKTGQYSDPEAEAHLAAVLIKRRDKIGRAYFTSINPLVEFTLAGGTLSFANAAVSAGFATDPPGGYRVAWARFDNLTREARPIGQPSASPTARIAVPEDVLTGAGDFLKAEIAAVQPAHAAWATPVRVYFRRAAAGWQLVGVERLP